MFTVYFSGTPVRYVHLIPLFTETFYVPQSAFVVGLNEPVIQFPLVIGSRFFLRKNENPTGRERLWLASQGCSTIEFPSSVSRTYSAIVAPPPVIRKLYEEHTERSVDDRTRSILYSHEEYFKRYRRLWGFYGMYNIPPDATTMDMPYITFALHPALLPML